MAGYDHDDCDFAGGGRGGRGGTRVLMVAEKPSICNSIAQHLAPGGLDGGYRGSPPVHEFEGTFRGKPVTFVVTSVVGHVFSIDFPQAYQNWDTVDPASLFSAPVTKKAEKGHIVKHLQELAVGVEYLVLWLDCDREGENICFEVITCCHSKMRHMAGQQVFRAKFSAIAKVDIERAMLTLGSPNENESLAVDARQELDLKVGVAFSRFQTKYFQGKYGDLDAKLVSYGPCQTPTLGFCVDRHDEIACFEPEDFWVLEVHVHKGAALLLSWERERLFDQGATRVFENLVRAGGAPPPDGAGGARVDSVSAKEGRRGRPAPLNTVEMLKVASKALGLGPHEAMRVAESLYLQGWMTYPRTESTAYPASFDIAGTLEAQRAHRSWGGYVAALLAKGVNRAKHGVDMGDHPPITPVRVPRPGDLSGAMERLYNVVARTFIASVSYDATFLTTTARFSCGGEHFSLSGKKLLDPGFTLIMESSAIRDTQLPAFDVGEVLELRAVGVRAGKTSPPGYLTEADLIGLMEQVLTSALSFFCLLTTHSLLVSLSLPYYLLARHRDGCLHRHAHQQHLPAQLRVRGLGAHARAEPARHRARARVPQDRPGARAAARARRHRGRVREDRQRRARQGVRRRGEPRLLRAQVRVLRREDRQDGCALRGDVLAARRRGQAALQVRQVPALDDLHSAQAATAALRDLQRDVRAAAERHHQARGRAGVPARRLPPRVLLAGQHDEGRGQVVQPVPLLLQQPAL